MANSKDPAHVETDEILKRLEKKLKTTYNEAYRNAADKFTTYMAAFQKKDASHRKDVAAGAWTQEQYESWRRNQLLYSDTLKDIRDTIATDLHNVNKIAISLVRDKQKDIYALNHNYGTYEVEKGAGVSTSYTLYDHDTVERLMKDDPKLLPPPSKKRQKEIDAKDLKWNKQKLSSVFTASILSGDDIPTMATRISTVAQMDRNAAIRNARTMSTGAENAGRTDSYKRAVAMGIDVEQEWMATLDGRTRDSHRQLDGEKVKVGKPFSNGLRFPADPEGAASEVYNCRCTLVAVVGGIDPSLFDKESVLKKDPIVANMTYEQWAHHKSTLQIKQEQDEKKAEETRKAIAEKKRLEAERKAEETKKQSEEKVFIDDAVKEQLAAVYGEEDMQGFVARVEKHPTIARLYNKYLPKAHIHKPRDGETSHYRRGGNVIVAGMCEDSNPMGNGRSRYHTLAHETGHLLDRWLSRDYEIDIVEGSEAEELREMDFDVTENASACSKFIEALRKDKGNIDDVDMSAYDLLVNYGDVSSGAQDALDGCFGTRSKNKTVWGHGEKYYNRVYDEASDIAKKKLEKKASKNQAKSMVRDYMTSNELWANINAAIIDGGLELESLKKYFPESVKAYLEIVGGIK